MCPTVERFRVTEEEDFYKSFKEVNPAIILGLILITLGLYIVNWIYSQNKELLKLDDNSPELSRCATLLVILPVTWFTVFFLLKNTAFYNLYPEFLLFVEIFGWVIILVFILKYIYDFCECFSNVTKGNKFVWFSLISIGIIGIIGIFFKSYIFSPFGFFLLVSIPAMQEELNHIYHKADIKKTSDSFYNA